MKYDSDDVDTAARTAWGEARGDGILGMLAVIWVIYNRARDNRWPDSPAGVARQPWQFSVWNQDDPNRIKIEQLSGNDELFNAAKGMARAIFDGQGGEDPTMGADHYFALWIDMPPWADQMTQTTEIGSHRFLKS